MDDRRLLIFRTVAEQRNFSRAAALLHLSQPTVSQQVQALEQEYGVRLLDRTSKSVSLTPAGWALYNRLRPLLQELLEIRRAVLEAAGAVGGPLVVGASLTTGQYVLPAALARFLKEYPRVDFHLQIHNTEQLTNLLLDGALDLGLVEGPVDSPDLVQEAFLEDELVFIAAPGHPWREQTALAPADLLRAPWVLREAGSGTRRVLEEHLVAQGLDPRELRVVTELASIEAVKGAVEAGLGVSAVSQWAIRKELRLGSLLVRKLRGRPLQRSFRVIYRRSATLLPAAAALLRLLTAPDLAQILG